MASLISSSERSTFEGALDDLFDTFKRNIVIYKDAQISIIDINQPRIFGYNETIDISNINYVPITGVYSALITYDENQKTEKNTDIGNPMEKGSALIKVKSDANDFIQNNGKTLNVLIDDLMFKFVSTESVRRFLASNLYGYYLERER
jgi:hypothetical protein